MNMTVTSIDEYPKGKGKVAVYLNNEFAFVLYKGELAKYGISEGAEVDDEKYDRLMREVLIKRATKRGMNLIKTIDRTESDIRTKLSDNGYPEAAIDAAVDYLKSFKYIDDLRYASEYYRFKINSLSRKVIESKLFEKGIPREIIDEALNGYEEEMGVDSHESGITLIIKLIKKRCPNGVEEITYEEKQKLFAYLYRKGFSVTEIEEAYHSISSK